MPRIVKYNGYNSYYKTYGNSIIHSIVLSIKPYIREYYKLVQGEYIVIYDGRYGTCYFPLNLWLRGLISSRVFSWKKDYHPYINKSQIEELND